MVTIGLAATLLSGSVLSVAAQPQSVDRGAALAEAERAVSEARQAVTRAENALENLRRSLGPTTPEVSGSIASGATSSDLPSTEPPPNENIPVDVATGNSQRDITSAALASSVANGLNGTGLKSSPVPEFQLIAAAGETEASLAWTIDLSGASVPGRLRADQLTLTATGRLNDGEARLLDLEGFPNGTRLQATYVHYWGRTNLTGRSPAAVEVAEANCISQLRPTNPRTCDAEAYDDGGVSQFVARFNPEGLGGMLEHVLPGPIWFAGAEFEGTQSRFKFLDRASFSVMSEDRFGFGGTIFGGALLGPRGQTAISASFTHRRQYEEQDPVTLIRPVDGSDLLQQLTGADGRPERDTQSILALQVRHAFGSPIGRNTRLAIAPELSVDIDGDAWSVDFPFYFASDAEGKLRGGVRAVYVNRPVSTGGREDDLTLGLFVGVPFSLFRD